MDVTDLGDDGRPAQLRTVLARNDVCDGTAIWITAIGTISLQQGELAVEGKTLTISGQRGRYKHAIDAGGRSRVFRIRGGSVTLNQLTITGGQADDGGGINLFLGDLTLTAVDLTRNRAGANGGGLFADVGSTVAIDNSSVADNVAALDGGALFNSGDRRPLYSWAPATLRIGSSTISGNVAQGVGGGVLNGDGATLTVEQSTISGNLAWGSGGGGIDNAGTVTVRYSTVAGNTSGHSPDSRPPVPFDVRNDWASGALFHSIQSTVGMCVPESSCEL
ncbi:MAG: hypothetical protein AB7W59_07885 [Acidimicrobiia bacterium]